MPREYRLWTVEEDQLLVSWYATPNGAKVCARLLGRTEQAIRARARDKGLQESQGSNDARPQPTTERLLRLKQFNQLSKRRILNQHA